ncbi:MAG: 50S ribosomal protein L13 [Verrucomicrobiales bacterium]|nr:MAG: 50S ribosomal protein L13 [Verrucomicrobiaceae bacterium TMED76]RCL31129.1 MAG: 50S ribosomal protein L13 [Verrucomicrobiota bacterium]|tara:strand:+ start:1848 stop:2276 length:429 start_codon:yes stop_codon:yes gene_type:complete
MKTFSAKPADIKREWFVIDATDQILGNVAVTAASLLRGKNKPTFTPHVDTGDFVVVINADKVRLSGRKEQQKIYHRYSGYVGGHHQDTPASLREKAPERLVEFAVKGMIPRNKLGRQIIKKLKIYAGSEHTHEAQNPTQIEL